MMLREKLFCFYRVTASPIIMLLIVLGPPVFLWDKIFLNKIKVTTASGTVEI
jgi:hypothetical protein